MLSTVEGPVVQGLHYDDLPTAASVFGSHRMRSLTIHFLL